METKRKEKANWDIQIHFKNTSWNQYTSNMHDLQRQVVWNRLVGVFCLRTRLVSGHQLVGVNALLSQKLTDI